MARERLARAGPLGKNTKLPSRGTGGVNDDARVARRNDRYRLRDSLRSLTTLRRVANCGGSQIDRKDAPQIRSKAGVCHYSGLQLCGAVHTCPVCSPRIRHVRSQDVDAAAAAWLTQWGIGSLLLLTLTMPHDFGQPLAETLTTIRASFGAMVSGRAWQSDKATFGVAHYIIAHDCTVGVNGWHPHLHVLLFTRRNLNATDLRQLQARLHERWREAVSKRGHRAPSLAHGVRVEQARSRADVTRYVCQVVAGGQNEDDSDSIPIALEIARGDLKTSRHNGQRTHWQVLTDIIARRHLDEWTPELDAADTRDVALWHEWEAATKGLPSLRWSRGLRVAVGLDKDAKTDAEIAAEDVGGETVYTFHPEDFRAIRATIGARAAVLRAFELGGERRGAAIIARYVRLWRARQRRLRMAVDGHRLKNRE